FLFDGTRIAYAHATTEFRGEPGILGLFEDGGARVLGADLRAGERDRAGGIGGVQVDAGNLEVLAVQIVLGGQLTVSVGDRRDYTGGPEQPGRPGGRGDLEVL